MSIDLSGARPQPNRYRRYALVRYPARINIEAEVRPFRRLEVNPNEGEGVDKIRASWWLVEAAILEAEDQGRTAEVWDLCGVV